MIKEVILVPKNTCPWDLLAKIQQRINNSWIFIHENVYQELLKSQGAIYSIGNRLNSNQSTLIKWAQTEEHPKTLLSCDVPNVWGKISYMEIANTLLEICTNDPEEIYFFKFDQ